jgi:GTP-binding protein EngB required for normal cell division
MPDFSADPILATDLAAAVDRLVRFEPTFRALKPTPERLGAVRTAAARLQAAVARERGADQPVLTVAFAGCTGAGKSTLINALARSRITRVIGRAATTRQAHVYHHRDTHLGGLPPELAHNAVLVPHERPELYAKVLIDTPDLDTAVITNRQTTRSILKAATLVLYVFTPEKYAEERVWSVIEQERRFSAFAAVLNKADRLAADELEKITEDLRGLFAAAGAPDVRIFRTQAIRHQPDENGTVPPPFPDDFAALRAFIERELQKSDIMRLARRQRRAAMAAVREAVDAVVPPNTAETLHSAEQIGKEVVDKATAKLVDQWRPVFQAAEDAILPAAKRRYHERFRGPIRAWFAMWDGIAAIAAKAAGKPADTLDLSTIGSALTANRHVVDDQTAAMSQAIQDHLHEAGLPVGRWTATTAKPASQQIAGTVAAAVEANCRQQALACPPAKARLANWVSWLSVVIVAAIVALGVYQFSSVLVTGQHHQTLLLILNIVALIVLSMTMLHLLVGVRTSTDPAASVEGAGRRTTYEALQKTMAGWLRSYRADLEADLAEVRGPLEAVEKHYAEEDRNEPEEPSLPVSPLPDAEVLPSAVEATADETPAPAASVSPAGPDVPQLPPPAAPVELPSDAAARIEARPSEPAPAPGKKKSLSDYLKDLG